MTTEERFTQGVHAVLDGLREQLERAGISVEWPAPGSSSSGPQRVKVVVVAPDLKEAVEEMGRSVRDQVVMVRVDEATLGRLDAWIATGAVKSRSEAAALFIQEGLKAREPELSRLQAALAEVDAAKERLRAQARDVFGG